MRTYSIHDVSAVSGLSRGQIDQLISRTMVSPWGRKNQGTREYYAADLFSFYLIGQLKKLGLQGPRIRDILASTGMLRIDRSSGMPLESFQGDLDNPEARFLVFYVNGDFYNAQLINDNNVGRMLHPNICSAAVVIDVQAFKAKVGELG